MAERCVQTMKASLTKTMEEGDDADLALLTYKTTPLSHRLPLPAEFLNSRKYKTLLPIHHEPRKTGTGTTVQQEHQSTTKT